MEEAYKNPSKPKSKAEACERLLEVIHQLMDEILAGETDPYEQRHKNPNDSGKTSPTLKSDGTKYQPGEDYPLVVPSKGVYKGRASVIPFPAPRAHNPSTL